MQSLEMFGFGANVIADALEFDGLVVEGRGEEGLHDVRRIGLGLGRLTGAMFFLQECNNLVMRCDLIEEYVELRWRIDRGGRVFGCTYSREDIFLDDAQFTRLYAATRAMSDLSIIIYPDQSRPVPTRSVPP